jgi:hypothetical protein
MAMRIHVGSTLLGIGMGVGGALLTAAAAKPAAAPQAVATSPASGGRYQIVSGARDGFVCAFVVDSTTGKVAVVPENGSPNVTTPQWGD